MTYGCDFLHPLSFKLVSGVWHIQPTLRHYILHQHWDIYWRSACSGACSWKAMRGWTRNLRTPWGICVNKCTFVHRPKSSAWKIFWMPEKGGYCVFFVIFRAVQTLCRFKLKLKVRDWIKVALVQNVYILRWGKIKAHSRHPSSQPSQRSCLAGTQWRASGGTLQKLIYRFPPSLFSAFPCSILRRMEVIIST